jgi:uncharacterized protein YbaP (TraB family)
MAKQSGIGRTPGEPEGRQGHSTGARSPLSLAGACLALGVALAWLGGCAANAPAPAASQPAPPAEIPASRPMPLLWRATGPAPGEGVIHLFGSVHVGSPELLDFAPVIQEAFAGADELVVEVDMTTLSPADVAREYLEYVMLPAGESLRDWLPKETYDSLAIRLQGSELPLMVADRMKPWAVATMLTISQFAAAGLEEQYGIDRSFLEQAEGQRPIRGLETTQSQWETFDGLSRETQALMLTDTLQRIDEDPSELVNAWARGDEAEMIRLMFGPLEEDARYEQFYEAVFFARNDAMAAKLAALARDGKDRFVVLGTGHMLGARGIPAQLAKQGFRVERVSSP